ncbi:hypothetical protein D770_23485 [Flammeovirgaceae bacterium 311]|nr:hypothetical protein D770_23485 [Flammeovirgaceae bacterium 311]
MAENPGGICFILLWLLHNSARIAVVELRDKIPEQCRAGIFIVTGQSLTFVYLITSQSKTSTID